MTTEIKQPRSPSPNIPSSTSSTSSSTTVQQHPLSSPDVPSCQVQSQDKGKEKANDTDTGLIPTLPVGLYSNLAGDISGIRRYADKILYDDQSMVELRSDGSLIITPQCRRQLPTELLSLIIRHIFGIYQKSRPGWLLQTPNTLYQCTLVSKSFHAIANPLLWRAPILHGTVSSKYFLDLISGTATATISPQRQQTLGNYIREMNLSNFFWTSTRMKRLLSRAPHLTDLAISVPTRIAGTGFQHLQHYGQPLVSLKLEGIFLSDTYFEVIGQHLLAHLRSLELNGCLNMLKDNLAHLLVLPSIPSSSSSSSSSSSTTTTTMSTSSAPPLGRLVMECTSMSDNAAEQLIPVIQQFNHLTHLAITHLNFPPVIQRLLQPSTTTTTCWPNLMKLQLDNGSMINDATWLPFMMTHPDLQHIHLSEPTISNTSLNAMAVHLPSLARLKLHYASSITSDGIRQMIRHIPSSSSTPPCPLVAIVLWDCPHIHEEDFPEIPPVTTLYRSYVSLGQEFIDGIRDQAL